MSLNSRQQTLTATPEWSRFLMSIPYRHDDIEVIARSQARMVEAPDRQTVLTNIRRFQAMMAGNRYPTADTVWSIASHMRNAGIFWASEPLLLYASGHLSEFVYTIVEIERGSLIGRKQLLALIREIDVSIERESDERDKWDFYELIKDGCQLPSDGRKRMGHSSDYEIQICNVIAKHFELGILTQRRAIIEHIITWLDGKVA